MSRRPGILIKNDKIGPVETQTIDGTERRLDLTPLAATSGYPMSVELEARSAAAYLRQGDSTVALDATAADNANVASNGTWEINVESAADAYIAVEASAGGTGTLAATRLDAVS